MDIYLIVGFRFCSTGCRISLGFSQLEERLSDGVKERLTLRKDEEPLPDTFDHLLLLLVTQARRSYFQAAAHNGRPPQAIPRVKTGRAPSRAILKVFAAAWPRRAMALDRENQYP